MQPDWKHSRTPDVSSELTEVRTVLSHAESALWVVERGWHSKSDADSEEIAQALRDVIARLDRWRKCRDRTCEGHQPRHAAAAG